MPSGRCERGGISGAASAVNGASNQPTQNIQTTRFSNAVEIFLGVYNVKQHQKYVSGEWTKEKCFKEFLNSFDPRGNKDGVVSRE